MMTPSTVRWVHGATDNGIVDFLRKIKHKFAKPFRLVSLPYAERNAVPRNGCGVPGDLSIRVVAGRVPVFLIQGDGHGRRES